MTQSKQLKQSSAKETQRKHDQKGPTEGSTRSQKGKRPASEYSGGSQKSRKGQNRTGCYRCGSASHKVPECPLEQPVCYYCKQPGHTSRDCTLKAQLEFTDNSNKGGRFSQQRQQRTAPRTQPYGQKQSVPPQSQLYQIQGGVSSVMPSASQYPAPPVIYYPGVPAQQLLSASP